MVCSRWPKLPRHIVTVRAQILPRAVIRETIAAAPKRETSALRKSMLVLWSFAVMSALSVTGATLWLRLHSYGP